MSIDGIGDIILIGLSGALLFFIMQFFFCLKAKRIAIRLIPVYIFLLLIIFITAVYLGAFGSGQGFIPANRILGIVLFFIAGIILIGEIIAWIIYAIRRRKNKTLPPE